MTARAIKLYGTEEPTADFVSLTAGPVTASFDAGQLRWITLDGVEVLRAISFLIRDRNWSTVVPTLSNLKIDQSAGGFSVAFDALCRSPDGDLTWHGAIAGKSDGSIRFEGWAKAERDFVTCRTGFVILHPIAGIAGHAVDITHVDGKVEHTRFPALIDPDQCFKDVRAMAHEVVPGIRAVCTMEGDTWETEDHRNWTDASYKTYVRPLELPWPYTIPAGTEVRQAVTLRFEGTLPKPAAVATDGTVQVTVGEDTAGRMPRIGLGLLPGEIAEATKVAPLIRQLGPQLLGCWVDLREKVELAGYRAVAEATGAAVALNVIVPDGADLTKLATAIREAGLAPESLMVTRAIDLKSYPPGTPAPKAMPLEQLYAATRAAFPGARIGGGFLSYFTELNRTRPPAALVDYLGHATGHLIHAADDRSVMETIETLGHIIRSTRALIGDTPYRVGPSNIGMSFNPYGATYTQNPKNGRVTMANAEPRQRGLFGAAFWAGYIAQMARGGIAAVTACAPAGVFGLARDATLVYPAFHVFAGLAAAAGAGRVEAASAEPGRVQALAYRDGDGLVLWLANLREEPTAIAIRGRTARGWVLDEASFDAATADPGFFNRRDAIDLGKLTLGGYAVARLGLPG